MYEFTHPQGWHDEMTFGEVVDDLREFMRYTNLYNIVIHSNRKGFMRKVEVENRLNGKVWTYRKIK